MQGSTVLSPRLRLPKSEIENIQKIYALDKSYKVDEIEALEYLPIRDDFGVSGTEKWEVFPRGSSIDASFKLYLHYCTIESIEASWRHPRMSLIGISMEKREVVYLYHEG